MDDEAIEAIRDQYVGARAQYETFASALAVLLERLCKNADVDYESVTSRAKTVDSLVTKLRTHENYSSLDDVTDKAGIRVITRYEAAVASVCELINAEFGVLESVTHGVDAPETFGYASRHLLVCFDARRIDLPEYAPYDGLIAEVQVRSILQHAWALISHSLDYKTDFDVPLRVRRRLFRVAALLETGDETFNAFVTEVQALRGQYRDEASTDWSDLALDMESAEVVWESFPWRPLIEAAEAEGWGPAREWTYKLPLDEVDRTGLSRLIENARDAGYSTWGQLASIATSVEQFRPVLGQIAAERKDASEGPWAIGMDVLRRIISHPESAEEARAIARLAQE